MPKFTAGKIRYFVPAFLVVLFLGALLAAVLEMYPGPPRDPVSIALFGEWVGPNGNSITFREDGTALGQGSDGIASAEYRWWVDGDTLTFRRIRKEQAFRRLLRNIFENLPGAYRDDSKIIDLTDGTLLLLDLDTNKAITYNRRDDVSE